MKRFTIPLQTEVVRYMKEKKGWPDQFCNHYGEKFWNHYQASGWKLSSGNLIKDWKACFNSQWQVLKYKEDIDLLNKIMGIKTNITNGSELINNYQRLDALLSRYLKSPASVEFNEFRDWYEFMKEKNFLKELSEDEKQDLKDVYGNNGNKLKAAWVMKTLDGYANTGLRIAEVLKLTNQLECK